MFLGLINKSNNKAFEELLMQYTDSLFNFAYRMTQNSQDAEDLVQESSIRAFKYFHKFKTGTNFKSWIMTILRNTFINKYRKASKEPPKVALEKVEGFVPATNVSGAEEEVFGEKMQYIVKDLPEELRTTLSLFYLDGFAYKDISNIMNVPIGTVMSRLYTARQTLKKKLIKYDKKENIKNELPGN